MFTANAISGLAQGVSRLAIPWYFAEQGQERLFMLTYGVITVVSLFWGVFAGTLIDRFSRKANFVVNNAIVGAIVGGAACYGFMQGEMPMGLIIAVFATTVLNYNIHFPNLYAFGQEITEPRFYEKTNSILEVMNQVTNMVSGAFGALLLRGVIAHEPTILFGFNMTPSFSLPQWGMETIFAVDAATYMVAAVMIYFIKYTPISKKEVELGNITKRIKSGFSYLKNHQHVLIFGVFSYMVFATLLIHIQSLLPAYVDNHLHGDASVFAGGRLTHAIGALFAGFIVSRLFKKLSKVKGIIILMILSAGILFSLYASYNVLVFFFVSVLFGFTNSAIRILRLTYLFNHVPNELIGRVNSIFFILNVVVRSIFIFLFSIPFFAEGPEIIWAYFILGCFILLSTVVLLIKYKALTYVPTTDNKA